MKKAWENHSCEAMPSGRAGITAVSCGVHGAGRSFVARALAVLAVLAACIGAEARTFGVWTHHNAYANLTHVVPVGSRIYALSDGKLYAYNVAEDSFDELNTTTTLNEWNDITDICYNSQTRRMVIAYENGNLDLLNTADNETRNISAIAKENTTSTKTITDICCHGKMAYVVMTWGVVAVNTERCEITQTYRLDTSNEAITGACVSGDSLYVEASQAIAPHGSTMIRGALKDNLLDREKWQAVDAQTQKAIGNSIRERLQSRNIYDVGKPTKKCTKLIEDSRNHCHWGSNDDNVLTRYALQEDGTYAETSTPKRPAGPSSNDIYTIRWVGGALYCVGEGWHTKGPSLTTPATVQVMNAEGQWNFFEQPTAKQLGHNYLMNNDIAVDPRDSAHVFVGGRTGVYEFLSGKLVNHFSFKNSPIKTMRDGSNANYELTLGVAYDKGGALWVLNSYCSTGLLKMEQRTPRDNAEDAYKWTVMENHPEIGVFPPAGNSVPYEKYLKCPFFDSKGNLWFVNTHFEESSFYRYNPQTDALKVFSPDKNQDGGSLYNTEGDGWVRCIAEDKEGNIWIGGTKGVAYIPEESLDHTRSEMMQHKVARNDGTGLADYLLATADVSCIAFDGANRMYASTIGDGIYIISADRDTELEHFTTENSEIKSNTVYGVAIDESTGTLYVSTDKGLCSVTTDAVEIPADLNEDNIKVYPNPVTPEYSGPITIEGLTVGADIKITTATGKLVHHARSTSGVYQWDGCDHTGTRCASGIYNILLADSEGDKGCVAKIAIVK